MVSGQIVLSYLKSGRNVNLLLCSFSSLVFWHLGPHMYRAHRTHGIIFVDGCLWLESANLLLMTIPIPIWKTLLYLLGKPDRYLSNVKLYVPWMVVLDPDVGRALITASPQIIMFRQDVIAKHPGFDPAIPLFPIQLATNPIRTGGNGDLLFGERAVVGI